MKKKIARLLNGGPLPVSNTNWPSYWTHGTLTNLVIRVACNPWLAPVVHRLVYAITRSEPYDPSYGVMVAGVHFYSCGRGLGRWIPVVRVARGRSLWWA